MESKDDDEWWNLDSSDDESSSSNIFNDEFIKTHRDSEMFRHIESIDDFVDDNLFMSIMEKNTGIPKSNPKLPGSMFNLDEHSAINLQHKRKSRYPLSCRIEEKNNSVTLAELTNEVSANILKIKAAFGILQDNTFDSDESIFEAEEEKFPLLSFNSRRIVPSTEMRYRPATQASCSTIDPKVKISTSAQQQQQQVIGEDTAAVADLVQRLKTLQTELDERTRRLLVPSAPTSDSSAAELLQPTAASVKCEPNGAELDGETIRNATKHIVSSLSVALDELLTAFPEDSVANVAKIETGDDTTLLSKASAFTCLPVSCTRNPHSTIPSEVAMKLDYIDKALEEVADSSDVKQRKPPPAPLRQLQYQDFKSQLPSMHSPFASATFLQPLTVVHRSVFKRDLSVWRGETMRRDSCPARATRPAVDGMERCSTHLNYTQVPRQPQYIKGVDSEENAEHQRQRSQYRLRQVDEHIHPCAASEAQTSAGQLQPSFYVSELTDLLSKEQYLRKMQTLKQSLLVSI